MHRRRSERPEQYRVGHGKIEGPAGSGRYLMDTKGDECSQRDADPIAKKRASKIRSVSRRPRETAMQGLWKFRIEGFPPVRGCRNDRVRQGDLIGYFRRLGPICQALRDVARPTISPRATWCQKADREESSPRNGPQGGHLLGVIRRSRELHFRFIWNIHNPFVCLPPGMSASVKGESFETRSDAGPGLGDMDSPWLFEDLPERYRGP